MPCHQELLEQICEILTPREREILQLMVNEGLNHRQIATRLGIGWQTVKNHMVAIYDKLCLRRNREILAILRAVILGEVSFM